jgi:hypothetical protein
MDWLLGNPKLFNYLILALFLADAAWWTWHGKYAQALYWLFAFGLNAVITWGFDR